MRCPWPAAAVALRAAALGCWIAASGASAEAALAASAISSASLEDVQEMWGLPFWPFGGGDGATTTAAARERYECWRRSGEDDVHKWSDRKRSWCCRHSGAGCRGEAPFDCSVDASTSEQNRSQIELDWCCNVKGEGCDDEGVTFDCRLEGHKQWRGEHKEWCCRRWGRGCVGDEERLTHSSTSATTTSVPTTTTAPTTTTLFNCVVGFAQWEKVWSKEQRVDCCKRFGRGCEIPTTTSVTTTRQGFDCPAEDETDWPIERRMFCCKTTSRGCIDGWTADGGGRAQRGASPQPAHDAFDCDFLVSEWESSWADDKKLWCCAHRGVGCMEESAEHSQDQFFDCVTGFENWQARWSLVKQNWCCGKVGRACAVPETVRTSRPAGRSQGGLEAISTSPAMTDSMLETTSLPYDCNRDLGTWESTWPNGKKAWCCMRVGHGCAPTPPPPPPTSTVTTTTRSSTTVTATSTTTTGTTTTATTTWTSTTTTEAPVVLWDPASDPGKILYDCAKDFDSWLMLWDTAKRKWCCEHEPSLAGHAMCFPVEQKFGAHPRSMLRVRDGSEVGGAPLPQLLLGAFASVALASSCVFMAYRSVLRMNDVEVSARRLADSGAEPMLSHAATRDCPDRDGTDDLRVLA